MIDFLREVALVAVIASVACVVVRWVVPVVFRVVSGPLVDSVAVLAAFLLLPEYWASSLSRRRRGAAPHLAYEYGSAVVGATVQVRRLLSGLCRGVAEGAPRIPLPLVAFVAAAVRVCFVLVDG